MPFSLRVLILEDRASDAELIVEELRAYGYDPAWTRVEAEQDFRAQLNLLPDLILADHALPQFDSTRALKIVRERGLDIPFILVSGSIGEDLAVSALQLGAADYLLKDRLARLGPAVARALEQKRLRDEKRRADELLRDNEARFRALIENSPDGIMLIDVDGKLQYVSPSTQRILGYHSEDMVGHALTEFIHADDLPSLMSLLDELIQPPGYIFTYQYRFRQRDGSWRWLESTLSNLLMEPGVAAIIINYRDFTERQQAEEALRDNEARLAGIITSTMDAIITVDTDQRVMLFNPAAERMFRCSAAEAMGQPLNRFIPARYHAVHQQHVRVFGESNITARKMGSHLPLSAVRTDGEEFPIETSISQIVVGGQKLFTVMLRDITERKRAENALRESEARFRALIEHGSDLIMILDGAGNLVYESPSGKRILGFEPDELIGRSVFEFIHPDDTHYIAEIFNLLIEVSGQPILAEARFRTRDGNWRILEMIGRNLLDDPAVVGIVINSRDVTERKLRERELEAIATVSAAMRTALTRAEMIPVVLDQVSTLLDVDGASLMMCDLATGEIIIELGRGSGEEFIGERVPSGAGVVGHVITTGRPYVTNDAQQDPLFIWPHRLGYLTAVACVPLVTHEQTIGALWVGRQMPVTESEVRLLSAIADIAANALHRAALFDAEHDQRTLAESLRDTVAALSSTLNFDEVLDRILTSVEQVVPHDAANIMLIDAVSSAPHIVRAHGYAERGLDEMVLQLGLPVSDMLALARMTETQGAVVISDTAQYPDWMELPETAWVRSYVGAPIRIKGQIVGFLNLDSAVPGFFTPTHAERVQAFADEAAVAIENAQLYQEIRRYAEELETRVADRTRELTEANRRLQELDRLKSKFVSDVSHELRTPITSLKLYVELLDHGKPEKQADYKRTLKGQAQRLSKLVEDILNLSRLELGAAKVQFEPVDLNALVDSIVVVHQPSAEAAGLDLSFTPGADLPPVQGERNQLAQVFTNLIANAINYTPRGTVHVRTYQRDQRICFEIQDSGMGIDPVDLPHLFDRFYRGKRVIRSKIRGTGLGLAIVKEIVDLHGGEIEVESEVDVGTTFRVWLPIADG